MDNKVLIFDDDKDILEVCSIVLKTNGFIVAVQNNCENILQRLDHHRPDVILMDNKIPPLGGIPACQSIRGSTVHARIPIVFFSANQDVARLAAEAGADFFIEKPFDLDELVSVLQQACHGRATAG